MELWINIGFAWIAVALAFILTVIWGLRLLYKKTKIAWIQKLNKALRRHHKLIGMLLIVTALVHGLFSSDKVLSLNWGTANWVVSILLGLSWMLRKKLHLKKWWIYIHRSLTILFVGVLVIHVFNVGGFLIDDLIAGRIGQPKAQVIVEQAAQEEAEAQTPTPEAASPAYDELPTLPPSDEPTAAPVETTPEPSPTPTTVPTPEPTPAPAPSKYIDGTYIGVADGFGPDLTVEVVIHDDVIVYVEVIDHNEVNERFWGEPVWRIPQLIVESQSTDVDIVSGATYTSVGIMNAVDDALRQALAE